MTKSLFAVILLLTTSVAWAQTSSGTVSGTLRDQTNAVIPAAQVTIVNTATNVSSSTSTNEVGFYMFPGVVPGEYKVSVEFAGMQKFEGAFNVQVRQSVVINPVLQAGGVATQIEIRDITPMVVVDNPTVGTALERARIDQLPIGGRSIGSLLSIVPGLEGQRAYGARQGTQEYIWDGSQELNRRWSNSSPPIGLEAVQEFRVDLNAVSAKYSRPTNVVISTRSGTNQLHGSLYETHRNNAIGVARRRQDTFTKAAYLNRIEYGGNMGGPVYLPKIYNGKERTFWFMSLEGGRSAQAPTTSYRVPTEAMRNGDFSELKDAQGRLQTIYDPLTTNLQTYARQPFSYGGKLNVIDPSRISPSAKYLFDISRKPTNNINPLLDVNWWGNIPTKSASYTTTQRLDHRFSDKDNFYVRTSVSDSRGMTNYSQVMLEEVYGREFNTNGEMGFATSWVHTFTPTLFNELMIAGKRIKWYGGNNNPENKNFMDLLGVPNPFGVTTEAAPQFQGTGLSGYEFRENTWKRSVFNNVIVDDSFTKVRGKHEMSFGAHMRYDQLNILPDQTWIEGLHDFGTAATTLYDSASTPTAPVGTPLTGSALANMYLGYANYMNLHNRKWFYLRGGDYALFFQDTYKVNRRLTLNYGMRWEYWPSYSEKNGAFTSFNPDTHAVVTGNTLENLYALGHSLPSLVNRYKELGLKFETYDQAGLPRNMVVTGKRDFGPRLGFAYQAGSGSTSFVVRGGYSLSYFPIPLFTFIDRMFTNTPTHARYQLMLNNTDQSPDGIQSYLLRNVPPIRLGVNATNAIDINKTTGINPGSPEASYFASDMPDSRTHTWNLTVEKGFAANMVARARYVGNHSANLEQYYRYNQNPPNYVWYASTHQALPTGATSGVVRRPFDNQVWGSILEYRKTGWSNYNGMEFEIERRYTKGLAFQVFYVVGNALGMARNDSTSMDHVNQFLPGAVPSDYQERNRFLNYYRDTGIPKHRVRWNWVYDLPFGKGKQLAGNSTGALEKLIGGWQIAGMGSLSTNYFSLPTSDFNFTGEPIHQYGYKYPIQNCVSGSCIPGYLWWNGYIPANLINRVDSAGNPTGYMGIPADYKPAVTPLIPWGSTTLPANAPANTRVSDYWDTNNVWIPLNNGTTRQTYAPLHPWRNQFFPSVRRWGMDASLFKNVRAGERLNFRISADFFNVLNMPGNPSGVGGNGILETRNSGQNARTLQLAGRMTW